ncbi:hypothetical protein J6590_024324 [Homalodisca vitripennis]|nr:hypothetical protein J6590_024324 [Homalodisca vitripennis]
MVPLPTWLNPKPPEDSRQAAARLDNDASTEDLNGEPDTPDLLGLFNLKVPGRTSSTDLFCCPLCSCNYDMNSTISRLHRLSNMVSEDYDFSHDSSRRLKSTFLSL